MKKKSGSNRKRLYLDCAASSPLRSEAGEVMCRILKAAYGNPSSLHAEGREAAGLLQAARQSCAAAISAKPDEIIFTAGGTESCNLAIFGVARSFAAKKGHFIASAIEHPAVLEPMLAVKRAGHGLTLLGVDREGRVDLKQLEQAIRPETLLVSVMFANNEIGTVQPIAEIGRLIRKLNQARRQRNIRPVLFHTDACQAAGFYDLSVDRLGVDLMTLNGGKIFGPKQAGLLYVRSGTKLEPLIYGGGQERGLRSGTQNIAQAAGLAKALQLAQAERVKAAHSCLEKQRALLKSIKSAAPGIMLLGPELGLENRLPNNLCFRFPKLEGEALLLYLDAAGIAVSTGSACGSNSTGPSRILKAIGLTDAQASESLRLSFASNIKKTDISRLILSLRNAMNILSASK